MSRRRSAWRLVALCAVLACQTSPIRSSEIAEDVMVVVHLDESLARERAEYLREREGARRPPTPGVARWDDIDRYLRGRTLGEGGGPLAAARFAGRLALLDPRRGLLSTVEEARRGAVPLAWSSDRRRLLFSQAVDGFMQIFELDAERGEVRRVTRGPDAHAGACYGPDGRFVYSAAALEGGEIRSRILVTEPSGLSPRPISEGPADHSPACASDGSAVAWVSPSPRGVERLMSRTPPLTGPLRRLGPGRDPAFSPDGRWIVFTAPRGPGWELYRVRPDGSGRAPIGSGPLDERQPSVSPDGRLVAYVADDGYRRHLHLRRMDGSGDRRLIDDGNLEHPTW